MLSKRLSADKKLPLRERIFLRLRFKKRNDEMTSAVAMPVSMPTVCENSTVPVSVSVKTPYNNNNNSNNKKSYHQRIQSMSLTDSENKRRIANENGMIKVMIKMTILVGMSIFSTFVFICLAVFMPRTGDFFFLFFVFFICVCICQAMCMCDSFVFLCVCVLSVYLFPV